MYTGRVRRKYQNDHKGNLQAFKPGNLI